MRQVCDKFATSLRHFCDTDSGTRSWRSKKLHLRAGDKIKFGGADRTRTDHLSNANAALYQMSYCPNTLIIADRRDFGKKVAIFIRDLDEIAT